MAISKVDRYGWSIKDEPGRYMMIKKEKICIDVNYQRPASLIRIARIQKEWSWISFGVLVVAERKDGVFFVVDGQHRLLAAMKREDVKSLPCLVFECDEVKEEALAFVSCNTTRKSMAASDKFRAMVLAGDKLSMDVSDIFNELGLIPSSTGGFGINLIGCVSRCMSRAAEDIDQFRTVMGLAREVSLSAGLGMSEILIEGLYFLHQNTTETLSDERLRSRIVSVGAHMLIDTAKRTAALFRHGRAQTWGTGMLEAVNKGLKHKFVTVEKGANK